MTTNRSTSGWASISHSQTRAWIRPFGDILMVGPEAQEAGEWNWVCFATAEPLTAVRDRLNEHVVYQVATGDDYVSDIPIGELRGVGSQNFSLGGLEHCPSGKFFANAAWLACAVIAHNLIRWAAHLLS